MKVILINPKSEFVVRGEGGRMFPLGLAAVAGAIKNISDVLIIDLNLANINLKEELTRFNPDVVGISCFMDTFLETQRICKVIKSILPDTQIVLGGPFATAVPEFYLNYIEANIVVIGESENTFPEIIKGRDFSAIAGIAYKVDGKIIRTKSRGYIDINHLMPDFSDCNPKKYLGLKGVGLERAISVTTSRGCFGKCSFCNPNYLGPFREMETESIEKYFSTLRSATPELEGVFFSDATFTASRKKALQLCQLMKSFSFSFEALCRADTLDLELLTEMKESGCRQIGLGIESLSPAVLKTAGKRITPNAQVKALEMIEAAGIQPIVYLLFGLPGDNKESIEYTARYMMDRGCYIRPNILIPIPGTPVFQVAVERGKIADLFRYVQWFCREYETGHLKTTGINLSNAPDDFIKEKLLEIWEYNKKL